MAGAYKYRPQYTQNTVGAGPEDTPKSDDPCRKLIERAIKMAWQVGSEGGSVESITYEDVISGADYD